jgi:hypothetical protein
MQDGAKKAAAAEGVDLTLAAGAEDGDEEGQIQAIENAVAQGQRNPGGRCQRNDAGASTAGDG